jgi:hypothetical protein
VLFAQGFETIKIQRRSGRLDVKETCPVGQAKNPPTGGQESPGRTVK